MALVTLQRSPTPSAASTGSTATTTAGEVSFVPVSFCKRVVWSSSITLRILGVKMNGEQIRGQKNEASV
ncbi:putative protein phosphatase Slingshot -like 1 [Scophthalmus maximus]|uniref:Uncharacterized protein n=1 Tax=Scophthalmus maximus TaxID=52904 RepID=A0A2U9BSA0_SCOMX|nr:putative protein phosphatase Slingshot -like 1 [Scophthalmus maximus]